MRLAPRPTGMRALARGTAVLVLAAVPVLTLPSAAQALSCVGPEQVMADSENVFVGRVSDARDDALELTVTEVWKGADLAPRLWLERAPDMDMWMPFAEDGEIEDGYSSPELYLVAFDADRVVGPCSMWPHDDLDEFDVAAPADTRPPVAGGLAGEEPPEGLSLAPVAAGSAGVLGLGAVAAVLWRRRRS